MTTYIKPEAEQVSEMLGMIIPNGVEASASPAPKSDLSHAAIYRNGDGAVVATCACTMELAAALGASLSMVPPNAVKDMLSSGTLTDIVTDNLYEVMNMFSSLFMNDHSAHLKLTEVLPMKELPAEASNDEFFSECFELSAGNYGTGHIVFSAL